MTKKDYELIASCIKWLILPDDYTKESIAREFGIKLASKNPRFNKEKFLKSCGVEVEYKEGCLYDDLGNCQVMHKH